MPAKVDRILMVNPAHLGDTVITTAILRELKAKNPQLVIDILCGSWSVPIFENHPAVNRIFSLDLPMLNRGLMLHSQKRQLFSESYRQFSEAIKNQQYDVITSLYAYEPSCISQLASLLEAPIVGFSSAGFGPLLTQSFNTMDLHWHEVQHQANILQAFLGEPKEPEHYSPWLVHHEPTKAMQGAYVVIHPGTGNRDKEWDIPGWRAIAKEFIDRQIRVVITGHGPREEYLAREISDGLPIENYVGKLSFSEFCNWIEHASLLIGTESVAPHIASAYSVPSLVLALGKTDLVRWKPLGGKAEIIDMRFGQTQDAHVVLNRVRQLIANLGMASI